MRRDLERVKAGKGGRGVNDGFSFSCGVIMIALWGRVASVVLAAAANKRRVVTSCAMGNAKGCINSVSGGITGDCTI